MEDLPQLYMMVVAPSSTDLDSLQLTIRDDLSMNSNSKVVTFFFQMTLPSVSELSPPQLVWNLSKLKDPDTVSRYKSISIELSKILLSVSTSTFPDQYSASFDDVSCPITFEMI